MHARIGDILEVDGYVPFPGADTLVVGRRDDPLVSVNECDRVHGAQMTIVLLYDFATTRIVAQYLFVWCAAYEEVFFVFVRIEGHTVGYLFVGEFGLDCARLGVPQFDVSIVGGRQEFGAISVEGNIAYALRVTAIGSDTATLFVELP